MEVNSKNTIVIIPVYNEARTIQGVAREIVSMGYKVLVIDDGSTDDSKGEASRGGAIVLANQKNLGKGRSLREGIKYILEKTSYEWMIMMDGDGQHHPSDIISLSRVAGETKSDMVVGNRMAETKNMPPVRYLTNRFMSWIVSCLCRQRIADSQCGYRILKVEALKRMDLTADRFDIESEILFEAANKHLKISSAPVKTIYGAEVSKIDPLRDTVIFFKLVLKHKFIKK